MSIKLSELKICFVGAGSMAEAIIRGLAEQRIASPGHIFVTNRSNLDQLNELHRRYGVQITSDSKMKERWVREADIIVSAMKPKDAADALRSMGRLLHSNQLFISVIAGLSRYNSQTAGH
jgi:pyrroline-5-carboxylate reductase